MKYQKKSKHRTHNRFSNCNLPLLSILIIILFNITPALFGETQTLFQKGVTFYDERDYEQALQMFLNIEETGIQSAELFYNIGNSYYRLNRLGKAVIYYKRGLRLKPNDSQLLANLNFVLGRTKDRQSSEESNPLIALIKKVVYSMSLNGWSLVTLIAFLIVVAIINFMAIYFRNRDKTVPLFLMIVGIVFFLLFSGVTYYRWNVLNDDTEAVLISSTANGYSGPATDFTHLFTIHEGMVFNVTQKEADWSRIQLPTGISGWIRNNTYETVRTGAF